jgi:hypothetical protein
MACVKKRRGRWVADYRDPTGKRHWESYDTKKEAEAALARSTVAIKEGRYSAPNDKRTIGNHSVAFTMDRYADAWPEQIAGAGEAAARLLLPTSGSKTVAGRD